ncbi:Aste57867_4223 [Aphanomyces stellatus]|uniref:Aste57867_4223 protein n=1 Tax=Aphanomyces stellatus TaxID=120398 RepID=A0A485KGE1_9STRA|nr:hypothetical protein As57867_004212 [Aphanomyces stellatus]VFT81340.1 Aste57867_4223 [Aphanomyces stellatus]
MDGDRAPVWNEEFVFDDVDVMNDQLELTIRHKGYLVVGAIGTSRIEMYDALSKARAQKDDSTSSGSWFPVWNNDARATGSPSGEILIDFVFSGNVDEIVKRYEAADAAPTMSLVRAQRRKTQMEQIWAILQPQVVAVVGVATQVKGAATAVLGAV